MGHNYLGAPLAVSTRGRSGRRDLRRSHARRARRRGGGGSERGGLRDGGVRCAHGRRARARGGGGGDVEDRRGRRRRGVCRAEETGDGRQHGRRGRAARAEGRERQRRAARGGSSARWRGRCESGGACGPIGADPQKAKPTACHTEDLTAQPSELNRYRPAITAQLPQLGHHQPTQPPTEAAIHRGSHPATQPPTKAATCQGSH